MLKITFDTNCLIYILDSDTPNPLYINELFEMFISKKANIAVTSRYIFDTENMDTKKYNKSKIRELISTFPVIPTIARWGIPESDIVPDRIKFPLCVEIIKSVVFPELKINSRRYKNKISDIDHLYGHLLSKRDVFVTNDGAILRAAVELKLLLNIIVLNPQDCLLYLNKINE